MWLLLWLLAEPNMKRQQSGLYNGLVWRRLNSVKNCWPVYGHPYIFLMATDAGALILLPLWPIHKVCIEAVLADVPSTAPMQDKAFARMVCAHATALQCSGGPHQVTLSQGLAGSNFSVTPFWNVVHGPRTLQLHNREEDQSVYLILQDECPLLSLQVSI